MSLLLSLSDEVLWSNVDATGPDCYQFTTLSDGQNAQLLSCVYSLSTGGLVAYICLLLAGVAEED